MGKSAPTRTVATMLARALEIGGELRALATPRARRLTQAAWRAECERLAGGAQALADARQRIEGRPYLRSLLARIAASWADERSTDRPAPHGAVTDLARENAAATEALHLGIDADLGGAVAGLMVIEGWPAAFGEATYPGEADQRTAALMDELEALNLELAQTITLADLHNVTAEVRFAGRAMPYSATLATAAALS